MSFARFKETFLRQPRHLKFIGIGSLVLALSTLLPWYADLDSYRIGDQFLGVTGPASFVGIVIAALAGLSFWIFMLHMLERRVPRLPVREAIIHLFAAIESVFLLIIVNSIFFHPKFGVNITLKESRFGMTLAFASAIALFIGAYIQNKEEIAKGDESGGRLEPLIKMEKSETPAYARSHTAVTPPRREVPRHESPQKVLPHARDVTKGFLFGEPDASKTSVGGAAPQSSPSTEEIRKDKPGSGTGSGTGGGSGSYMIRMDL